MTAAVAMAIAFRVDASLDIGTGHVMRCLTLAEELRAQGAICHFISREHNGHLLDIIQKHGFDIHVLPLCKPNPEAFIEKATGSTYAHWLGCDREEDARQTGTILAELRPDWLVVDHYSIDARWERSLKGFFKKLLVIDDLADRLHESDVLLDQNLGRLSSEYEGLVSGNCNLMIGPRYALLRPEFSALRSYSLKRREHPEIKKILVSMGGVDQSNATSRVLDALKNCSMPLSVQITIVMGAQAPYLNKVRDMALTMPWETEVLENISNMAQVMADNDLAIGAAGSTSWERCCVGLPTLLIVLAENQRTGALALQKQGAAIVIGEPAASQGEIPPAISTLMSGKLLSEMISAASVVTDGLGTLRVVNSMGIQS